MEMLAAKPKTTSVTILFIVGLWISKGNQQQHLASDISSICRKAIKFLDQILGIWVVRKDVFGADFLMVLTYRKTSRQSQVVACSSTSHPSFCSDTWVAGLNDSGRRVGNIAKHVIVYLICRLTDQVIYIQFS